MTLSLLFDLQLSRIRAYVPQVPVKVNPPPPVFELVPDALHGTSTGYQLDKCRCEDCRQWNRDKSARQRARDRSYNLARRGA